MAAISLRGKGKTVMKEDSARGKAQDLEKTRGKGVGEKVFLSFELYACHFKKKIEIR